MRLAKLEMLGFKSFMHKAELHFEQGITAILGPNGCGKSNIVDAIRWVLGEQSAKMLRGTKMENVIFDGTKQRPPMGFAEVALTFTGASERLPVEWDEISIKRRVTREGGSEYFLNNQPYRLHEIRDLLAGSGLGNHAYAVIERDMVEEVLDPSGDKRRILFEEASGIMRYKLRRKESLSKLASTESDLTRLDDILEELGKTVRSLKYQMGRARSFQRLQDELREAELFDAGEKLHACWRQDRDLLQRLAGLDDSARAEETRQSQVDEQIARLRAELLAKEAQHQSARDELDGELAAYRKAEEELAVLDEKARAEQRQAERLDLEIHQAVAQAEELERQQEAIAEESTVLADKHTRLEGELVEARRAFGELDGHYQERRQLLQREKQMQLDFARSRADTGGEVERLRERLSQNANRLAELAAEGRGLAAQIDALREELTGQEASAENLREGIAGAAARREDAAAALTELAAATTRLGESQRQRALAAEKFGARLELLEGLEAEKAGYPAGARWLLEAKGGQAELRGALADAIRVDAPHRAAVEAALEHLLSALVVSERESALDWLEELRAAESGRALLLSLDAASNAARAGSEAPPHPALIPLASLVHGDAPLQGVLERLLDGHYLAPDRRTALAVLATAGDRDLTLVTPQGFLLRGPHVLAGGSAQSAEAGALGRQDEIAALRESLETATSELRRLAGESEEQARREAAGQQDLAAVDAELAGLREQQAAADMEKARLETRLHRLEEEREELEAERRHQERGEESLNLALVEAEGQLLRTTEAMPGEDIDLSALEEEVAQREREREAHQARLAATQLELTTSAGRREALALRHDNVERSLASERARAEESRKGAADCRQLVEEYGQQSRQRRESLGQKQTELEVVRQSVQVQLDAMAELREAEQTQQGEARQLREQQREQEQARHGVEMERNTLAVKMEAIVQRIREEYDVELDSRQDPLTPPIADAYRPPENRSAAEEIERLRDKIKRIGPVNLMALEEFEEKNKRFEFLQEQRGDLMRARDGLMETIRRINQEAKQRFSENFRVVRKSFIEIFTTLFEGGEADLSYTTDEDPLQADIVVTAKPKEKNISSVQLLSTGEKTLTALSLLFAIYLSRPSPFCVFDEVDAPLDDANIARFLRLVREFSARTQFLLITHNKKTMEVARHLYGVTMEESGVSKMVSVAFDDIPEDLAAGAAAGSAS